MSLKEIDHLEFTEANSGHEVFMRIGVVDEVAEILLTGKHNGDISGALGSEECKKVLEALRKAGIVAQDPGADKDQQVASMRFGYSGSKLELVVSVGVNGQLVMFDLALEGDENEEDEAVVYLTVEQCNWLIEALWEASRKL